MADIVLVHESSEEGQLGIKMVAAVPSVHLKRDVPDNCNVYLFYFPGHERYEALEKELTRWGEETGNNLFVGFWGLDDPNYNFLTKQFKLSDMPAIVMTGNSSIASIESSGRWNTAYLRIDSEHLLSNTEGAMDCLERSYNLFNRELIAEALKQAHKADNMARFLSILWKLRDALGPVGEFLDRRDIEVGLAPNIYIKLAKPGAEGEEETPITGG